MSPPSSNFLTTYSSTCTRFARDPPPSPSSLPRSIRPCFTRVPLPSVDSAAGVKFRGRPVPPLFQSRGKTRAATVPTSLFETLSLSFPFRFCGSPGIAKFPANQNEQRRRSTPLHPLGSSFLFIVDCIPYVYTFISVVVVETEDEGGWKGGEFSRSLLDKYNCDYELSLVICDKLSISFKPPFSFFLEMEILFCINKYRRRE